MARQICIPVTEGAALASFSIEIDATALFYRQFIVIGSGSSFIDSRQVQSLQLDPGRYPIQVQSGASTTRRASAADILSSSPRLGGTARPVEASTLAFSRSRSDCRVRIRKHARA
jgi:hypothetical protein